MLTLNDQPDPIKNEHPAVWDLVLEDVKSCYGDFPINNKVLQDIKERDKIGQERYNTRLQPFNGRNALIDALQEFYDAAVYLRQCIYEQEKNESGDITPIKDVKEWKLGTIYWHHMDNLMKLREYFEFMDKI